MTSPTWQVPGHPGGPAVEVARTTDGRWLRTPRHPGVVVNAARPGS